MSLWFLPAFAYYWGISPAIRRGEYSKEDDTMPAKKNLPAPVMINGLPDFTGMSNESIQAYILARTAQPAQPAQPARELTVWDIAVNDCESAIIKAVGPDGLARIREELTGIYGRPVEKTYTIGYKQVGQAIARGIERPKAVKSLTKKELEEIAIAQGREIARLTALTK